jgi:hypothetical protein
VARDVQIGTPINIGTRTKYKGEGSVIHPNLWCERTKKVFREGFNIPYWAWKGGRVDYQIHITGQWFISMV